MKADELFCKMWDAPYVHGTKYSGSCAHWIEDNTLYITFQQTVQKQDWKQNFKVKSHKYKNTRYKGTRIHLGFFQQYNEIFYDVLKETWNILDNNKSINNIVVCGWSQGAVLAYLFYQDLQISITDANTKKYSHKCIVYGMPNFIKKSSEKKWNEIVCGTIIEFQNSCDLFTYLPLGYTKPDTQKVIFGEPFNLAKALQITKYHTSYIKFDCDNLDLFNI